MRAPDVHYAKTPQGVHIADQVVGDGPIDLLFVPGYASNLQWQWELPSYARFLERLASFSRLIVVDRRGAGLSDRFSPEDLPPLEDPLAPLTNREREVLGLIAEGMSNRAIAARLFVTQRTVEAHVTQIFQKLGLTESAAQHRRVLAVLTFLRA